jgi:hypothetical protein
MNAIQKALSDVKNRIPRQILERAFIKAGALGGIHTPVSLDYRIREEVINERVIPDCNLVGGTETTIPLYNVVPKHIDTYNTVYRIPKSMTQGRTISKVLHLSFGQNGVIGYTNPQQFKGSALMDAGDGLVAAHLPIPMTSTAYVSLIGENTVLVRDTMRLPGMLFLRCVLEADSEFSHLKPQSIPAFSKLVEYATKAYIYNKLVIEIDQAELSGGVSLGRFKEIIDGYADANELYEQYFNEVWQKVALFNDPEAFKRHLKLISGGRH